MNLFLCNSLCTHHIFSVTSICFVGFAQCELAYLFMANRHHIVFFSGNTHQCLDKHAVFTYLLHPLKFFCCSKVSTHNVMLWCQTFENVLKWSNNSKYLLHRQLYLDARVEWEKRGKKRSKITVVSFKWMVLKCFFFIIVYVLLIFCMLNTFAWIKQK